MRTEHDEIRLILCIDLDADPITGSLTSAGTATRRFSGWIALAAALEATRAEMAQPREGIFSSSAEKTPASE